MERTNVGNTQTADNGKCEHTQRHIFNEMENNEKGLSE
jgi:hypothetical protein